MPAPTFVKDPSAELDYGFDWAERGWLKDGESVLSATWTVPAGLDFITMELFDGRESVAWIAGGTVGTDYTISCRIATSAGRTDERSMLLKVRDR